MSRLFSRRLFVGTVAAGGALVACGEPLHASTTAPRRVVRVSPSRKAMVGEVFKIRRTLPGVSLDQIDPFLILDHFDFTIGPEQRGGLAPHPHRGIETVTVLFEGAIEHGDSLGNRGARVRRGAVDDRRRRHRARREPGGHPP